LEAAHKAAVLVKNQNNTLPINPASLQRVAIIGPNSDITVLGGYSDEPRQTVSILEGLSTEIGDAVDIVHAKGVKLTNNRSWWDDEITLANSERNRDMIADAITTARGADLIVLAIGGDESTSREAWSETHLGDRDDITLIGEQTELIEALAALDIPMVGVVISGRPLALADVESHFDAILYGWLLGQETGTAVADLLVGHVSPSGKMPVSVPRNVGQIPVFYNHKPTARRGYAFAETEPLYPFGFGLSYAQFEISEPELKAAVIQADESTAVSVEVSNTGSMQADEIVQMYIRDKISSVTRPVLELKGFERVSLAPGETKTVTLAITPQSLQFYNRDMQRVVEPGEFDILVGASSQSHKAVTLRVE